MPKYVVLAFGEGDRAQRGDVQVANEIFPDHDAAMQWIREDLHAMITDMCEGSGETYDVNEDPIATRCVTKTSVIHGKIFWVYSEAFEQYYQIEEIT